MDNFLSVSGTVVSIENAPSASNAPSYCTLMAGIQTASKELIYLIIDISTYFVDYLTLKKGERVTAFYDSTAPAPLIYPPRYQAVVISKIYHNVSVKVDYFNEDLISSNNMLQLNISNRTKVILPNNQTYLGQLGNQNLAVIYSTSTKSIPAQTTPYEVIVLCHAQTN